MTNPEYNETESNRETLVQIAQDFLLDGPIDDVDISKISDTELGEYIQLKFQKNIENFYETSGLAQEILDCKDDEEALHLVANKSEGVHGWMDMLPNLIKSQPGAGMNCTMGSAVLHMGLESLKYPNVRTVVTKGHSVVLRESEEGVKLYDPSTKSTKDGKLVGYTQTFSGEQIIDQVEVEEKAGRKGYQFILDRGEQDEQGGFHADEEGKFVKKFYAFDPSIKMNLATALDNLSEIEKDAENLESITGTEEGHKHAKALVAQFPELKTFDLKETEKQFDLFSSDKYVYSDEN